MLAVILAGDSAIPQGQRAFWGGWQVGVTSASGADAVIYCERLMLRRFNNSGIDVTCYCSGPYDSHKRLILAHLQYNLSSDVFHGPMMTAWH